MIYTQPTSQERINMRYTIARLEPLRTLLSATRLNMEEIALNTNDKNLKRSVLSFVAETAPCEEQIKNFIESLGHAFAPNDITHPLKNEYDNFRMSCPFECAGFYEIKIVKLFRDVLNDYRVIAEVRHFMRSQLNEVLYSFLKLKMLANFSRKEIASEGNIF